MITQEVHVNVNMLRLGVEFWVMQDGDSCLIIGSDDQGRFH